MIEVKPVVLVEGRLENIGPWDYQEYEEPVIGNPFPGPMTAPEDWNYQITYRTVVGNPLPEGAVFTNAEVFLDRAGSLRLVSTASEYETEALIAGRREEFRIVMQAVVLGIATEEERATAIQLREYLKLNGAL